MDNRLIHSPDLYKQKLSDYAAYTIDVATPVGIFRQKASKYDGVTVIDSGDGGFRIYMSYLPAASFGYSNIRIKNAREDLFARITIDQDVTIEIKRINPVDYMQIGWYILLTIIAVIKILKPELIYFLPVLLLIPLPFLVRWLNKNRFKNLVIDFLNTVAAS